MSKKVAEEISKGEVNNSAQLELPLYNTVSRLPSHLSELLDALHVSEEPGWPDAFGKALRPCMKKSQRRCRRALSLFTGAGGLDIGFHDAGFEIVTMVEIAPKFVASLSANVGEQEYLGNSQILCADIMEFYPDSGFDVDLVIGGPPCQPFSAAGRRAAGAPGLHDARGNLFQEFSRILEAINPKAFVFENVYGLTGVQAGHAWRSILSSFTGLGYKLSFRILDTADYGVPQHRERVFLVGVKGTQYLFPKPTHGPDSPDDHPYYSPEEALLTLPEEDKPGPLGGRWGHLLNNIPTGLNYSFYTSKLGHPQPLFAWRSKFSDFLYKADPYTPVRAIKATGGQYTGPFHWDNRPFSVAEFRRLQTIPDEYKLIGSRQLVIQQIGNSVPPQMARILALSLLNQVWGVALPARLELLAPHESLNFRKRKAALTTLYQKKASEALAYLGESTKVLGKPSGRRVCYRGRIDLQNFDWQISEGEDSRLFVEVDTRGKVLSISLTLPLLDREATTAITSFDISILPSKLGWDIPFEKIKLIGNALTPEVFIGLWKALEYHLAVINLKTDLVQLSGYYQYSPRLIAEMSITDHDSAEPMWQIVGKVVSGVGIRQQFHLESLAAMWGVSVGIARSGLQQLRFLGYEVRGRSTNVSIVENHFLIPYCYPTLNPRSVQLRKHLEV